MDYLVAFDKDLLDTLSEDEMDLVRRVTVHHKKANPDITHVSWEERDSITAIFFDESQIVLITTWRKANQILNDAFAVEPPTSDWDISINGQV